MLSASTETFDSHSVQAALPPERQQTSPSSPSLSPPLTLPSFFHCFYFPETMCRNRRATSPSCLIFRLFVGFVFFVARRLDLTKAIFFFLFLSLLVSVTFSISLWRQTGRKKPVSRLDLAGRRGGDCEEAGGGEGEAAVGRLFEALHRMLPARTPH